MCVDTCNYIFNLKRVVSLTLIILIRITYNNNSTEFYLFIYLFTPGTMEKIILIFSDNKSFFLLLIQRFSLTAHVCHLGAYSYINLSLCEYDGSRHHCLHLQPPLYCEKAL